MIARIDGNKIKLYGEIWYGDGPFIIESFQEIDGQYDVIEVHLHTPGGSVIDGNLIYNAFKNSSSKLHVYVDGLVASMGTIIMLPAERIYMSENAWVMVHAPMGGAYGTAEELRDSAKVLEQMAANFLKAYSAKTGRPMAELEPWMQKDNWMNSEEALKEGIVDEIVDRILDDEDMPQGLNSRDFKAAAKVSAADFEKPLQRFSNAMQKTNQSEKSEIEMKKELIKALGLQSVNAESSDTAVIEAVQAHYKSKLAEMKAKLDKLEKEQKEKEQKAVDAMLDKAVKEGKIDKAVRGTYEHIAEHSGIEALSTVLEKMEGRKSIADAIKGKSTGTDPERDKWTWDDYQKNDVKALEALEESDPEKFQELYEAKFKKA